MHASLVFEQVLDLNNPIVIVNFMNDFQGFAASTNVFETGPKKKNDMAGGKAS